MRISIGSYFALQFDDPALTQRLARLKKISAGDASRNAMKREIRDVVYAFEEGVKRQIRQLHGLADPKEAGGLESLKENATYEAGALDLSTISAVEERLAAKLQTQAPLARCKQRGCQQWALAGGKYCAQCEHDL